MLIVEKCIDEVYSILDTDDMISEDISKTELLEILQQGYFIWGTSEFAIQNNIRVNLILRMYDKDNNVKDYDGLILRDAYTDYNEFLYQVMDIRELESLSSSVILEKVISILKFNNKQRGNIISNYPIGYKVFSRGDNELTIKELSTGNLYSADFFGCLSVYLDENLSIEGITEINADFLEVSDGSVLFANTVLSEYSVSYGDSLVIASSDEQDDLSCSYDELDTVFKYNDFILATECGFPLYNIKNKVTQIRGSYIDFDFNILTQKAIRFKDKVLYFEDGSSLSSIDLLVKYFDIIRFESDDLASSVNSYLQGCIAKERVLRSSHKLENLKSLSVNLEHYIGDYSKCNIRINDYIRHPDIMCIRTKFGVVYERQSTIIDADSTFKTLFLVRITRTGSTYYDMEKRLIVTGTGQDCNKGGCLCNDTLREAYNNMVNYGYTYFKGMIVPLCVSRVILDEECLDIRILCLIMPNEDFTCNYDFNLVEVPLIYLGSKLFEYDDCYSIRCMFSEVSFEKALVENIWGSFEESNFLDLWENLRVKNSRETYNNLYKHSKSVLKQVLDSIIC